MPSNLDENKQRKCRTFPLQYLEDKTCFSLFLFFHLLKNRRTLHMYAISHFLAIISANYPRLFHNLLDTSL